MTRMVLGSPLAALITITLFFLMGFLIRQNFAPPGERIEPPSINIFRDMSREPDEVIEPASRTRPTTEVQPPPPPAQIDKSEPTDGLLGPRPDIPVPNIDPAMTPGGAYPLPVVRVSPIYPTRAVSRGVEGQVLLVFDIDAEGSVMNVRVLEADPPGYFERNAMRAVEQWKYRPQMRDGQPAATRGVQVVLTFSLAEE